MTFTRSAIACLLLFTVACGTPPPTEKKEGSGHVVLKPLADPAGYVARARQLIYVPAYSSIYWGFDQQVAELAITLSIRNVNLKQPIVIHSAKYYGSDGDLIRDLVPSASELGPLATADFVVQRRDTTGGTGASFLVEWSSAVEVDDPVIEAVMVGQHGNAGISFTTTGRVLQKASAGLVPTR
jgi:hypothetical protein